MKHPTFLSLLPLALALAGCADTPQEAFAKAQKEFAAHDYNAARIHLANALQGMPGDKAIILMQAKTLLALGDGEGARAAIGQLTGGQVPTGELAELAAEAALLRGQPDEALAVLGTMQGVEADRLRGLAAIKKGDTATAATMFARGKAAGGNARLFADYARLLLMSGDIAGAKDLADQAARLAPDGIDTLLLQGDLAVRSGDLNRALAVFERAGQLYPASLAPLIGRASVLGDMGRTKDMKPLVDRAAEAAPDDLSVAYLQVRLAALNKDWGAVRSRVQGLEAKLGPLDPIRQLYGEALLRLGQAQQAISQLQPIVRAMPANRAAIALLAEAQLAGGDARAALTTIRPLADSDIARSEELALAAKVAKAAGDPAATRYEARSRSPQPRVLGQDLADGDAAMRAGNWAGAVESYERILKATDGRNVVVLNNLAYAQTMLGNFGQARDYSARALKLAPENASVLDTAGWAAFKSGDVAAAKGMLRKAAQLAPQNATIRAHLAEAERAPG